MMIGNCTHSKRPYTLYDAVHTTSSHTCQTCGIHALETNKVEVA